MITVHHLILLSVESYLTLNIFSLLLRVITCSISTLLLVVLSQFLTSSKRGEKV
jgi:hypothetical protein